MGQPYPGNSLSQRNNKPVEKLKPQAPVERGEEKQEDAKVSKVVKGRVVERNKSLGRRFRETFFDGEARGVMNYVVFEVLVPSAKDVLVDVITQFAERALWGESRPRRSSPMSHRPGTRPWVQYGGANVAPPRDSRREEPRYNTRYERNGFQLKELIFMSTHDADGVLQVLENQIDQYGTASVVDLYDACGMSSEYTDERWGWYELNRSNTRIRRLGSSEFTLDLPSPTRLDQN